mgnify:CR=1 FL=1
MITILEADDWKAIYNGDELLDQGHALNVYNILRQLGYTVKTEEHDFQDDYAAPWLFIQKPKETTI